jgi:DNA transformation protein
LDSEAIRDVFQAVGRPLQIRRMFGGQGVYQGDVMFALVARDEIYLKADAETVDEFRNLGSKPFAFDTKGGTTTITSYWLMPASGFDEPDEAARFADLAMAAALRARRGRNAKKSRRKTGA